MPQWILDKNSTSNLYENTIVVDINNNTELLYKELDKLEVKNTNYYLSKYLVKNQCKRYILFNLKFNYFIHAMEIDLYNAIRNAIIRVDKNCISAFALQSKKNDQMKVAEIVQKVYLINMSEDDFVNNVNSGNITVVGYCNSQDFDDIKNKLSNTNIEAERIDYDHTGQQLYDSYCLFNGRFYTIVIHKKIISFILCQLHTRRSLYGVI